ncbi:ATPase, T2SS/T4P/T4SS family [Sphingomonas azotifigens]|uniref:ATPase, T2SS/T4P/T4SS family n=1 Tax=Sphingomonas azotifigens TaxID=330920 RepID=UPI001FE91520|nr:ATPase, T2SS/T4P/T4SS family [Sphingomonas azotifigens]
MAAAWTPAVSSPHGMLDTVLEEAVRLEASHLHLTPGAAGSGLAFRIGGLIHPFRELRQEEGALLAREILIGAELVPNAPFPQRGELRWRGGRIDVFSLPVIDGARLVLRREPGTGAARGLDALGAAPVLAQDLRVAVATGGLLLVAAPAGNGRSTTLRTLLALAASRTRPALAIASGAEKLTGVTWADPAPGTVAETARAAIEQDFDVLLIDSITDRPEAAAAMHAAQSGRLVLAGVEAPNAVAAIQQLRTWRVEAFQLASSLNMVVAQRLVRRLCPACREPVQASGSVSALLGFDPGAIVYAPAGCPVCDETGFAGETAVFESIRGDATIRRLINDGGDAAILARHAFISTPNLGSAARALARTGVTTPEEAVRISRG